MYTVIIKLKIAINYRGSNQLHGVKLTMINLNDFRNKFEQVLKGLEYSACIYDYPFDSKMCKFLVLKGNYAIGVVLGELSDEEKIYTKYEKFFVSECEKTGIFYVDCIVITEDTLSEEDDFIEGLAAGILSRFECPISALEYSTYLLTKNRMILAREGERIFKNNPYVFADDERLKKGYKYDPFFDNNSDYALLPFILTTVFPKDAKCKYDDGVDAPFINVFIDLGCGYGALAPLLGLNNITYIGVDNNFDEHGHVKFFQDTDKFPTVKFIKMDIKDFCNGDNLKKLDIEPTRAFAFMSRVPDMIGNNKESIELRDLVSHTFPHHLFIY